MNALYALLSPKDTIDARYFNDVTRGGSGRYSAGPGYDLVTGLGTPRAGTLIPYLRGAASGAVVNPADKATLQAGPAIRAQPPHSAPGPGRGAASRPEPPWA